MKPVGPASAYGAPGRDTTPVGTVAACERTVYFNTLLGRTRNGRGVWCECSSEKPVHALRSRAEPSLAMVRAYLIGGALPRLRGGPERYRSPNAPVTRVARHS
jgi:hypothetical protein